VVMGRDCAVSWNTHGTRLGRGRPNWPQRSDPRGASQRTSCPVIEAMRS